MAKGKRKHGKKHKKRGNDGADGVGRDFWVHLLRETLGNFAGQLMADNAPKCVGGDNGGGDGKAGETCDVAADVMRVLSESGPKSIADLLAETRAGLPP